MIFLNTGFPHLSHSEWDKSIMCAIDTFRVPNIVWFLVPSERSRKLVSIDSEKVSNYRIRNDGGKVSLCGGTECTDTENVRVFFSEVCNFYQVKVVQQNSRNLHFGNDLFTGITFYSNLLILQMHICLYLSFLQQNK